MRWFKWVGIAVAGGLGVGAAKAQDAPIPAPGPSEAVSPADADWRVASRASDRANLIDVASRVTRDGAVTIRIARVRNTARAGDYSHAVNLFAVRCQTNELHLIEESDIAADGLTAETYPVDEPWLPVAAGTVDEGVKTIACGEAELTGSGFPSVRAFIDAGRP